MLKTLYILLICYMPILDSYLPRTDFGRGIPDIGPVRIFSYLLIVVFFINWSKTKHIRLSSKWIGYIVVYSIIVMVSVLWSNHSFTSNVIQSLFNTVFLPLMIAIIGVNIFAEQDNVNAYVKNIIIASFILSLISMYQLFSKGLLVTGDIGSTVTMGNQVRSTATFNNPNALAIFLVLSIPCLIYALQKQLVPKMTGWIFSASLVGGIICTVSRKGISTGILAFALYYFFKGQKKKIVLLVVATMFLALIFSGYAVISKRFTIDSLKYQFAGKWAMTYAGWQMYKKSPLIGLGYKGYYDNFGKYFPWSWKEKYDAHNIFITALANYGLIGFIPFLCIFLCPLFAARRTLKIDDSETPHSTSKDLAIICISSIIPFMLSGWFAGGLFYNQMLVALLYTNISLSLSSDA